MGPKEDGGTIAITIGESPIIEYVAGHMEPYEIRHLHVSETFTAHLSEAEGYLPLRIHLWRTEDDDRITQYLDNIQVSLLNSTFEAPVDEVRYDFGGQFEFSINAGAEYAHQMYMILQSMTGPYPGFTLGSGEVHVPLQWDAWTDITLSLNPYWCNFYGVLDHEGKANAQMSTFGALPADTNALSIQLVALVFDVGTGVNPVFATNPVNVLITKK